MFGQRAEASGLLRVDSPDPEGGLSRPPPLWSVLGGLAGHEKKLRPKHLPSLGPMGIPGQVRPHVGALSAFCSDSGLVLSFPAGPQRGRSRPCQRKSGHYKGTPMGPPSAQLGRPHRVHPLDYPRDVPSISVTGAPGTRRWRSEAGVLRSESRGGPGRTRSQGEEGALSVHQRPPIPEQRGTHKAQIPPPCEPQNLRMG